MKDFKASKVVFKLPEKLEPNTSYWVRSGKGFDLYLSDVTGSVAYKPNVTSSQLADTLPIGKGGTGAEDAAMARGNLGLGTAATKNTGITAGALVTADNIRRAYGKNFTSQIMPSEFNWNDIQSGDYFFKYYEDNGYVNAPPFKWCSVECFGTLYGEGQLFAIAYDYLSPQIALRTKNNNKWCNWAVVASNGLDAYFASLKSGQASYAKGWRKLTVTLPNAAGEITKAHGVTTVETVQAKVTNSDGIIIYNNDIDPANQFYVRVNGANLILGVTASSTKVFGKAVTIYVGEEL